MVLDANFPSACDLHLIPLPSADLTLYENSYIFTGDNLYYINSNGKEQSVPIRDLKKFQDDLDMLNEKNASKICLKKEQIYFLITSNGGHTPPSVQRFNRQAKDVSSNMVRSIERAFFKMNSTIPIIFTSRIFVSGNNVEKLACAIEKWTQISEGYQLCKINDATANSADPTGSTWLYIASMHGQVKIELRLLTACCQCQRRSL